MQRVVVPVVVPIVVPIIIRKLIALLLCSISISVFAANDSVQVNASTAITEKHATSQKPQTSENPQEHGTQLPVAAASVNEPPAESLLTNSPGQNQTLIADKSPQPKAFKAPSFGFAYYVQLLLGLAFVIALIYACAWIMRRVGAGGMSGAGSMRVIASLPVGSKERVVLVQVGETQMLLGVAPGSVNTLQVFTEPVVTTEPTNPFAEKLKFALGQRGAQ